MAKKATHTFNGVMPNDAKPMIRDLKLEARTSRKEVGIYMALKFITSSKKMSLSFKKYVQANPRLIEKVEDILRSHEFKKGKG